MQRRMRNLLWAGFLIVLALEAGRLDLRPLKQRSPAVSEQVQSVFVSVLVPLGAVVLLSWLFWRQAQSTQPLLHGSGCVAPRSQPDDYSWCRVLAVLSEAQTTLSTNPHNWFGVLEALPQLGLRSGDLVRFRPITAASTGDLMVFQDRGSKHVRRCEDDGDGPRFTGGPPLSEEARVLGRVDLVVRSVPRV
jgi:hypothetical protein